MSLSQDLDWLVIHLLQWNNYRAENRGSNNLQKLNYQKNDVKKKLK